MKILLTALLFLFVFSAGGYAQSQGQMNADAYAGYTKADKQLNTVYQMILRQYAKDVKFIRT